MAVNDDNLFAIAWDMAKRDEMNIAEPFAGLASSRLTEHAPLGLAGLSAAAKERGHNVHAFDWGKREDGVTDAELRQGDPNYHYDDITEGSISQLTDRVLAPFDGPIDFLGQGVPCKSFSLAGETVGWKINEDTVHRLWDLVFPGKDFPHLSLRERVNQPHMTAAMKAFDRLKPHLNKTRGQKGGWGMTTYEPRSIDELMFHESGEPRIYGRKKEPISEKRAEGIRGRTTHGLDLLGRATGLHGELDKRGKLGHGLIENPMGKLRYMNEISHLPLHEITAASYRQPAHSRYLNLPNEPREFDFGRYMAETNPTESGGLPPLKPTDLFGDLPPSLVLRPRLPKTVAGDLYHRGPRGSRGALQGVKGLPKNELFPGSPRIDAYHVKSMLPYQLGNDLAHALERHHGIDAPNPAYRGSVDPNPIIERFRGGGQTTLKAFDNAWEMIQ